MADCRMNREGLVSKWEIVVNIGHPVALLNGSGFLRIHADLLIGFGRSFRLRVFHHVGDRKLILEPGKVGLKTWVTKGGRSIYCSAKGLRKALPVEFQIGTVTFDWSVESKRLELRY